MYHLKLNPSCLAAFMGCTPGKLTTGLGMWKQHAVVSDVGFANVFSEEKDGREVDKRVVSHVLHHDGLAEYIRSIGVEAEIQGYTLWETVASFLSTQKCFSDPTSGKLVKPHIRACLYAANQFCKAHQDHVGPAELVVLVSLMINKNGVAGCLAFQCCLA